MAHIDWNVFLVLCKKLNERPRMVSTILIRLGLVNATSNLVSVQSSEVIMVLAKNYVLEERVVKNIIGEIVLDLRPKHIEKVFHLPHHQAERWYRDHEQEAT